jgi:hypothetical protein
MESLIMILLTLGLIFTLVIAAYLYKKKTSKTQSPATTQTEKPDPTSHLIKLNLDVRKAFIGEDLSHTVERVIDKLVDLIPVVEKADLVNGELSWTVNRISSEYLPNKCVYPFLKLDKNKRAESIILDSFNSNLNSLSQELDDVSNMLSNKDETEFTKKAKFLKHKFNTDGEAS